MIDYILNNKEWIFSGIGITTITILIFVIKLIINKKDKRDKETKVVQKIKKGSHNIQVGRDYHEQDK